MVIGEEWDDLVLLANTAFTVWESEKPNKIPKIRFILTNGQKKDDHLRPKKPTSEKTSVAKKIPTSPLSQVSTMAKWDNLVLLANTAVSFLESELIPKRKRKLQSSIPLSTLEKPTKIPRITFILTNGHKKDDDLRLKKPTSETSIRTSVGKKIAISPPSHPSSSSGFKSNPQKTRKQRRPRVQQLPFPEGDGERAMPIALRDWIISQGGTEIVRVLEKRLFPTDVKPNNNRLSMPTNKLQVEPKAFTSEQEWAMVKNKDKGLNVSVVDEEFREFEVTFKMWKMSNCKVYNLISNWNSVVQGNNLQENDPIQLWAFRKRDNELAFALVKV